MILAQRSAMIGNGLPYDAEVEYLESTGTQWIDTGVRGRGGWFSCDLTFVALDTGARWQMCFGKAESSISPFYPYRFGLYAGSQEKDIWFENGYESKRYGNAKSLPFTLVLEHKEWRVQKPSSQETWLDRSIRLFSSTFGSPSHCVVRSFDIWNISDVLVRDFHPVRVGSGPYAMGYLYDRANPTGGPLGNGLYPNAGAGTFIIGPDVLPSSGGGGNKYLVSHYRCLFYRSFEERRAA